MARKSTSLDRLPLGPPPLAAASRGTPAKHPSDVMPPMRDDFMDDPHIGLAAQKQSAVHDFPMPHASSSSLTRSPPPLVAEPEADAASPDALAREAENQASIEEMLRINGVTADPAPRRRNHDPEDAGEEGGGEEVDEEGGGARGYGGDGADVRSGYGEDEEEEYAEELDVLGGPGVQAGGGSGPAGHGRASLGSSASHASIVSDVQVAVACGAIFALVTALPLETATQRYVPALRQRVPWADLILRALMAGVLTFVIKRYVLPVGTPR